MSQLACTRNNTVGGYSNKLNRFVCSKSMAHVACTHPRRDKIKVGCRVLVELYVELCYVCMK